MADMEQAYQYLKLADEYELRARIAEAQGDQQQAAKWTDSAEKAITKAKALRDLK